jgi:DNA-directed RNA polymerase II subunit RPB4
MTDVPCLSVAECNELLTRLAEKTTRPTANSDVYLKTREYVSMFARFKDSKTVTQVDAITSNLLGKGEAGGVTAFERAQLGRS